MGSAYSTASGIKPSRIVRPIYCASSLSPLCLDPGRQEECLICREAGPIYKLVNPCSHLELQNPHLYHAQCLHQWWTIQDEQWHQNRYTTSARLLGRCPACTRNARVITFGCGHGWAKSWVTSWQGWTKALKPLLTDNTGCEPCRKQLQRLKAMADAAGGRIVPFDETATGQWVKSHPLRFVEAVLAPGERTDYNALTESRNNNPRQPCSPTSPPPSPPDAPNNGEYGLRELIEGKAKATNYHSNNVGVTRADLAWVLDHESSPSPAGALKPRLASQLLLVRPWDGRPSTDPDALPAVASPSSPKSGDGGRALQRHKELLRAYAALVDKAEVQLQTAVRRYRGCEADARRARAAECESGLWGAFDDVAARRALVNGYYGLCVAFDRLWSLLQVLDKQLLLDLTVDGRGGPSPRSSSWRRKIFEEPSSKFSKRRDFWGQKARIELMRET